MTHLFTRRRISIELGVLIDLGVIAALLLAMLAYSYWKGRVDAWIMTTFASFVTDPVDQATLRLRVSRLLGSSRISLFSTAIVVAAMIMSTRRFAWWRWALILLLPFVYAYGRGYVNGWLTSGLQKAGMTDRWYIGMYTNLGINLLVSALIAWIVSSRLVLVAGVIAAAISAGAAYWIIVNMPIIPGTNGGRDAPPWQFLLTPVVQAVLAIGLVAWAWRLRELNPVIGMCAWCGYDLRGSAHSRCPECGMGLPAVAH